MAKGDGSISEVRRGVWRVCVSLGTDPVTGKRIKVQRNVHGTKVEARKERDRIRQEHENGMSVDADRMVRRVPESDKKGCATGGEPVRQEGGRNPDNQGEHGLIVCGCPLIVPCDGFKVRKKQVTGYENNR